MTWHRLFTIRDIKGITHGVFYIYINYGILPVCTKP